MKRTQRKDAWRNIRKQSVSFASIIVIALLGVTAYLGICYAAEAMQINGSRSYNALRYRDLEIVSTMLLTEDDVECLRSTEGVTDVEPLWQTGANVYLGSQQESLAVITVTERLNQPTILEGRLPQAVSECAVEKRLADRMGWGLGDKIEWLEMTEATGQYFLATLNLLITGIVEHPDHANRNVPDALYVLVTRDAFDHEALDGCCMKALVAVDGLADAHRFSASYNDAVTAVSDRIEALAAQRTVIRDAQIHNQGQSQIDDADDDLREAKEQLEEARAQLDDGWQQLAEGEQKLIDGEKELAEAKVQLDEAPQQLAEAERQLAEAKAELDEGKQELTAAKAELDAGEQELTSAREELDEAKTQLDEGGQALYAGQRQLYVARRQLEDGWNELEDAKGSVRSSIRTAVEVASGEDTSDTIDWAENQPADVDNANVDANDLWITTDTKVDMSQPLEQTTADMVQDLPEEVLRSTYDNLYGDDPDAPEYDPEQMRRYIAAQATIGTRLVASDYDQLAEGCAQWNDGHDRYLWGSWNLYASKQQYAEAVAAYEEGEQAYAEGLAAFEEGLAQYNEGLTAYEEGLAQYTEGLAAYEESKQTYLDGLEAYEQGLTDFAAGKQEIAARRQELEDGEQTYADGLAEYEYGVQMRDAALAQLSDMEPSRWIVLDGRGNASFVQLRTSSQNLSRLQMTFSLLFVVIGSLVIYATISKMVDEQRTLVGATKALGFYNGEVFAKYLLFGLLATVFGTFLGILLARFWIEGFILNGYSIYFIIDFKQPLLILKPTLIVISGAVFLAVAAVTFACLRLVRMPAIQLMQAPVPKGRKKAAQAGKHLLSLYSRLVLLNIRTDIKRVLVTIVSVAGCCTLVVIGFTLKYAVSKCMENQYTDVVAYDGRIGYDYGGDLEEKLRSSDVEYVSLYDRNVTFRVQDIDMGELLCGDIAAIEGVYRLNDWETGEPLVPTDEGIFIQRRLAEIYDLTVGSEFEMTLNNTNTVTVRVAGIFENYLGRTMVMSSGYYKTLCGQMPTNNAFFVRFGDIDREAYLDELKDTLGFAEYTPSDAGKAMFEAATSIINAVVALFIFMAAVMAGVVLLNLTNIYILQKKRELTIMRVNGFTTREVISYVTRETVITTISGIILGLIAGSAIGYRIVRALEQSFFRLERGVCFSSWLYAAAMTVFFTVIVNVIALRKVKDLKLTDVA